MYGVLPAKEGIWGQRIGPYPTPAQGTGDFKKLRPKPDDNKDKKGKEVPDFNKVRKP